MRNQTVPGIIEERGAMSTRKIWHLLYPCLTDKDWLIEQLRSGKSRRALAREIGCDDKTLREALQLHGIHYPHACLHNPALREFEKKLK